MTESLRPKLNPAALSVWITIIMLSAAALARFIAVEERQGNQLRSTSELRDWVGAIDARQRAAAESRANDDRYIQLLNRLTTLEVREQTREALEPRRRR